MLTKARKLLKKREGQIAEGKLPGIQLGKVTFNDLAEDFLTDYRINKRDTLAKAERCVKYLKEYFGGMRATDVRTDRIKNYIEKRMEQGLSNASINRELAALKRMFHLAAECTPPKVNLIPHIPVLKESNVRKGYFERGEYLALKDALPEGLRTVITFAYHLGWRKAEILGLTWDKVDLKQGTVRLDPGETKNEEARSVYIPDELLQEVHKLLGKRQLGCLYLFHRNGEPIKDFRAAWDSACIKAGLFQIVKDEDGNETKVATKLFHDFRRTAVRDMVRASVPERVAMMVTGHKTRSVFDRYNIGSDQDLREAATKKQIYYDKQSSTIEGIDLRRGEIISFQQTQGLLN